jgi:hypothetical protein
MPKNFRKLKHNSIGIGIFREKGQNNKIKSRKFAKENEKLKLAFILYQHNYKVSVIADIMSIKKAKFKKIF